MVYLDYQRGSRFPLGGTVLLVLALAGLLLLGGYYRGIGVKAATLEMRLEKSEGPLQRRQAAAQTGKNLEQEMKSANDVLRQLTLPWDKLFDSVEAASGGDVALLAMEPDFGKRTVKISGEARNLVAMLNYVAQLEAQGTFGAVYLQSHQVQQSTPEKPVQFTAIAAWEGKL